MDPWAPPRRWRCRRAGPRRAAARAEFGGGARLQRAGLRVQGRDQWRCGRGWALRWVAPAADEAPADLGLAGLPGEVFRGLALLRRCLRNYPAPATPRRHPRLWFQPLTPMTATVAN